MHGTRGVVFLLLLLASVTLVQAQRGGGGGGAGGGGSRGGSGGGAGAGGAGAGGGGGGGGGGVPMMRQQPNAMGQSSMQGGADQQPSMQSQQQMRVRSQATDQQRSAIQQTLMATKQLRTELRPLTQWQKSKQIVAEDAKRWQERIRAQMGAIQLEQEALITILTPDQQSFVGDALLDMNHATEDLMDYLERLYAELSEEDVDEQDAKEAAKKADGKVKKLQSEEAEILDELGLLLKG